MTIAKVNSSVVKERSFSQVFFARYRNLEARIKTAKLEYGDETKRYLGEGEECKKTEKKDIT